MNRNQTAIVEEYADRVWNKKDLSAIDEFLDPNVIIHSLLGEYQGKEYMVRVVQTWLTGFPDLHVKNLKIFTSEDTVALQWIAKGTHKGKFKGIEPTGKTISYSGMAIYRVKEGKIIEYWGYLDMQNVLDQMTES